MVVLKMVRSIQKYKYPVSTALHELYKTIGSPQIGLLKPTIIPLFDDLLPNFHSIGTDLAGIHRVLGYDGDIQYHLGGYGMFYEEAFIKAMSEAMERYCLMMYPHFIEDEIVFTTYKDLVSSGEDVIPSRYFQLFTAEEYQRDSFPFRPFQEDATYGWLQLPSLLKPNREIWVPAQVLFPGYRINHEKGEHRWSPGFSTGAASHVTIKNALYNGLMEFIEIDSYMIHWYAMRKADRIILEGTNLNDLVNHWLDPSLYELVLLYQVLPDLPVPTVSAFLYNKKGLIPFMTAGAQTDLDVVNCIYRAIMEAAAVTMLGFGGYIYQPNEFIMTTEIDKILDLDSNVAFYVKPSNKNVSIRLINDLHSGKNVHFDDLPRFDHLKTVEEKIKTTLRMLANVSEHAVAFEITVPDVADLGFRVVKTYIPELHCMALPSYPYSHHPRMLQHGGVKNKYPHPIP